MAYNALTKHSLEESPRQRSMFTFDERRDIVIVGDASETINYAVQQFIAIGQQAIKQRGNFFVALSGGQTPNAIFQHLSTHANLAIMDWSKVFCFWSDERSEPPTSSQSNYFNAMHAGLARIPIAPSHIFRMIAEEHIEENAHIYEETIHHHLADLQFDLIMLGMGEDGHTASLFPHTQGLREEKQLIIANHVPQKNTYRMSMTYKCINLARHISIYVMGENKASMVSKALLGPYMPNDIPIQRIGTTTHKALWILDQGAGSILKQVFKPDFSL